MRIHYKIKKSGKITSDSTSDIKCKEMSAYVLIDWVGGPDEKNIWLEDMPYGPSVSSSQNVSSMNMSGKS